MGFKKIIIVFLLFSLTASSCSGKKTEKDKEETVSENNTEAEENIKENNDNFGGKGDRIKKVEVIKSKKKIVPAVPNIINTEENMINHYFLLSELSGKEPVIPEDFEIGGLYTGQKELKDAVDLITLFFNDLKTKKVNKDIIEEENRFYLGKIFDEYVKNNYIPETVRIGTPLIKDDKIYINLRLIKKSGKTAGRIIIIKKKNKWFISGFQGDLSLMNSEEKESDVRFEPEIYKFQ